MDQSVEAPRRNSLFIYEGNPINLALVIGCIVVVRSACCRCLTVSFPKAP